MSFVRSKVLICRQLTRSKTRSYEKDVDESGTKTFLENRRVGLTPAARCAAARIVRLVIGATGGRGSLTSGTVALVEIIVRNEFPRFTCGCQVGNVQHQRLTQPDR